MENYSEGSREVFRSTIEFLKELAGKQGVEITDEDISGSLGITIEQFREYYNSNVAPEELFPLLREKYHQFIGNAGVKEIWFTDEKYVEDPDVPAPDSEEEDFQ